MKDEERLIVINRINNDKELLKILDDKKSRKKELSKNNAVKEYLKLSNEITKLNKKLIYFEDDESIIELEFIWAFYSRIKDDGFLPCNHDIWLYKGSYNCQENYWNEHNPYKLIENESKEKFLYNEYVCLECGKIIQVTNYQDFERNNIVLKDSNQLDTEKYIYLYYRLLYNYPVEEARKMLIEEFYKNKDNLKKKTLEKN